MSIVILTFQVHFPLEILVRYLKWSSPYDLIELLKTGTHRKLQLDI